MTSRIEVHQTYRYTYSEPITDVHQKLVMVPPHLHLDQRLVWFSFEVRGADPGCEIDWSTDSFGNRVCRAVIPAAQQFLEFDARYIVEHTPGLSAPFLPEREVLLQPTPLTAPDARLSHVAQHIGRGANSPLERAERAHDWAAIALTYRIGATGVRTSAATALHLGKGVCQDYAHILLSVLRLLDIPARYVSGQLLGDGVPHAWVEALVGDEVIAYDPTHHRRTSAQYVTVAVGRDYADIAPTSGRYAGAATGVLSATKHARVVGDSVTARQAAA